MRDAIFETCQQVFPAWRALSMDDFWFEDPKGFSSFTMTIRAREAVEPSAILYRHLAGKENAILDFEAEKAVFLELGTRGIAAHCHHYDAQCRMEAFYTGRTLTAEDLFEPDHLRQIANALHCLHQIDPRGMTLPEGSFFELLHKKWGALARFVLEEKRTVFPAHEQSLCDDLRVIDSPETLARVRSCLPDGPLSFCHNDTYHGNIMKLDSGEIKLLDFEFSCLNHKAFDFANLFAETVMKHKQPEYPFFRIAEPEYTDEHISMLIGFYLDNEPFENGARRAQAHQQLLEETKSMIRLSDYMYAMAALPLAVEPIQKIRFIPYAHQRLMRFFSATTS